MGSVVSDSAAPLWLRRIFWANLVAQVGIVVTGGIVRLTGSGLGCPTWPECVDGSLTPTQRQAEAWHKYVEFGNRLLTFVLAALAVAAAIGVWRWTRQRRADGLAARRAIVVLALAPLLGTVAQAVLGGITVLTGLHPAVVAAHFLLSMAIIAALTVLTVRAGEPADEPRQLMVRRELLWWGRALMVNAGLVIIVGTVVTGSGPNSGDADVAHRFGFDQRTVAWLHADLVLLFIGLLVGMALALRLTDAPASSRRAATALIVVTLANAVVGYAQLAAGLPWLPVALHMLLACLIWVAVIRLQMTLVRRGGSAPDEAPVLDAASTAA